MGAGKMALGVLRVQTPIPQRAALRSQGRHRGVSRTMVVAPAHGAEPVVSFSGKNISFPQ